MLSDIQFASHIKKATNLNSPFVKNNLHIMPNPQSLYGDGMENLTFYAELYNLDLFEGTDSTYSVDYIIENVEGEVLNRIRGRQRPKRSENAAIYASFDISNLKSNRYTLKLDALDNNTNRHVNISKNFSVFRRAEALAFEIDQERSVYSGLDESALQNYFNQIAYIATNEEKTIFKQLEVQGKREFLFQFWERRDPSPGTQENEFKDDYIQRLFKTKINFSYSDTEGWRTDRGRILLIYGAPDFIDREPALPDRNAHEVWSYETLQGQQGQSIFVFIDFIDNGNYRLMHSDYRDEINNPNWESYLYK
jgi:GWxTD domain-containing protein